MRVCRFRMGIPRREDQMESCGLVSFRDWRRHFRFLGKTVGANPDPALRSAISPFWRKGASLGKALSPCRAKPSRLRPAPLDRCY
jgi:hypothetical protein